MIFSYHSKTKRAVGYKRKRNFREWTYSSRREIKVSSTKTGNRKRGGQILAIILTVLTIVKLALELATELMGSGKRRRVRPLPELTHEIFWQTST
jgi:hypothetical protein